MRADTSRVVVLHVMAAAYEKAERSVLLQRCLLGNILPRQPILPLENSVVPVLRKSSYDFVYVFSCTRTFTSINGSVLCVAHVCLLVCN